MCVRLYEKQRQGGAVTSVRQKGMNKQVDGTKTMKQRKCLSDVKEFGEDPPGGGHPSSRAVEKVGFMHN